MKKNTMLLIISLELAVIIALMVAIVLICADRNPDSSTDSVPENQSKEYEDVLLGMFDGDPLYRTDGTLVVDAQKTQTVDATQGHTPSSQDLVKLFNELISSKSFLSYVSEDMGGRYSIDELRSMISCKSRNETQVLEVIVTGKVPEDIYEICNSVLAHAADELPGYVGGIVRLLDPAIMPETPIKN